MTVIDAVAKALVGELGEEMVGQPGCPCFACRFGPPLLAVAKAVDKIIEVDDLLRSMRKDHLGGGSYAVQQVNRDNFIQVARAAFAVLSEAAEHG